MTHPHHWMLDSPTPGVTEIPARCRDCGAERTFAGGVTESYGHLGGAWRSYPELRAAAIMKREERTWLE